MTQQSNLASPAIASPLRTAPRRDSFLATVRIDHGPPDLLSRFFIAADAVLNRHGVDLQFGTFEELSQVNRQNRESWLPLNPTFEPANGLVDARNSFVILGVDSHDRVVTATALRVFDWRATDLKAEAESLRLICADPERFAPTAGQCLVTAPAATSIRGIVGYAGAGWLHPSVRKNRLGAVLSRILRAYAYTRWQVDVVCAISSLKLIGKGYTDQNGYRHMQPGICFRNPELGPPEAGLVWITANEAIEDLSNFLGQMGDAASPTELRRAQNDALVGNQQRQQQTRVMKGGSAA